MDLFEKRRSIRKYTGQPVSEDVLRQLLEAARLAPSGNHTQPWYFIAVTQDETKRRIITSNGCWERHCFWFVWQTRLSGFRTKIWSLMRRARRRD